MELKVNLDLIAEQVGQNIDNAQAFLRLRDVEYVAKGLQNLGMARGLCRMVLENIKGLGPAYDEEARRFSESLSECRKIFGGYLDIFTFGLKVQVSRNENGTAQVKATLVPPQKAKRHEAIRGRNIGGKMVEDVSPQVHQQMMRMRLEGKSVSEIAEATGRSYSTVSRHTRTLKMKPRRSGSPNTTQFAKINMEQANEMREYAAQSTDPSEKVVTDLAEAYQLSRSQVYNILRNKSWRQE